MARISTIQGITAMDPAEARQRSRGVARRSKIDAAKLSQAHLKLALIKDQFDILAGFYPESNTYKKGLDYLQDVLHKGLEKASTYGLPNELRYLYGVVDKAKRMSPAIAGIGEFIPENCKEILDALQYLDVNDPVQKPRRAQIQRAYEQCVNLNNYAPMLNQHLEGSAHHLLYEYAQPHHLSGVVAAKTVAHRNAISSLSDITGVERSNLRQWFRNGIMRENANKGMEPFSPEKTIEILKTEVPAEAGIGGGFLAVLPLIIELVVAAIGAIAALIALMKKPEQIRFETAAQGIGSETFGPEKADWLSPGATPYYSPASTPVMGSSATPFIAAGLAYLILK